MSDWTIIQLIRLATVRNQAPPQKQFHNESAATVTNERKKTS